MIVIFKSMIELLIVCGTILAMSWIVTRSLNAYFEQKRATAIKYATLAKMKGRKKKGADDDDTGTITDAILAEWGLPPEIALPIIKGYVEGFIKKQQTTPDTESKYT